MGYISEEDCYDLIHFWIFFAISIYIFSIFIFNFVILHLFYFSIFTL